MQPFHLRRITNDRFAELWDDHGVVATERRRELRRDDITELLRAGPIQFMVAAVGDKPRWIPVEERFSFWKSEAKVRIVEGNAPIHIDEWPDHYCYTADEWCSKKGETLWSCFGGHECP